VLIRRWIKASRAWQEAKYSFLNQRGAGGRASASPPSRLSQSFPYRATYSLRTEIRMRSSSPSYRVFSTRLNPYDHIEGSLLFSGDLLANRS